MNRWFVMLLTFIPVQQVLSCCMLPLTYKGTISQNAQEAVIFHNQGMQDMILRINYEIEGQGAPAQFAWIITVPNEPEKYAVAKGDLFKKVFGWANPLVEPPPPRLRMGCNSLVDSVASKGLVFSKPVKVGPYDIQPVKVRGAEALDELNRWLAKNGFPTEDPAHMKYFVENKFTFLCIKINSAKEQEAVNLTGDLEPLHLTFKSEQVYYPLRFSSRQGVFNVNLTVLTRQKLDYKKSAPALKKINWSSSNLKKNVKVSRDDFPEVLAHAYQKSAFKALEEKHWYLNVIRTTRTNYDDAIAKWDSDVFFRTGGPAAKAGRRFLLF